VKIAVWTAKMSPAGTAYTKQIDTPVGILNCYYASIYDDRIAELECYSDEGDEYIVWVEYFADPKEVEKNPELIFEDYDVVEWEEA